MNNLKLSFLIKKTEVSSSVHNFKLYMLFYMKKLKWYRLTKMQAFMNDLKLSFLRFSIPFHNKKYVGSLGKN